MIPHGSRTGDGRFENRYQLVSRHQCRHVRPNALKHSGERSRTMPEDFAFRFRF